jgi:hypothetical protein
VVVFPRLPVTAMKVVRNMARRQTNANALRSKPYTARDGARNTPQITRPL